MAAYSEYLALSLFALIIGITVGSSGTIAKLFQKAQYVGKSSTEIEANKRANIVRPDSKDSTELELLNKYEIMKKFPASTWQRQAYDAFAAKLGDKERIFPCIYASKGWKDNDLLYMFLPSEDISERRNVLQIARAVLSYVPESHKYGLNTSLVIITPNSEKTASRTVEDYHKIFWTMLKSLRQLDPKPWPSNISDETESNRWCFCFDGKPAFLAVLTPAHEKRKSRHLQNFCFVYQPRWVFELLLTTDEKRAAALKNVRGLIDKYDYPLPHSPDIANFGEEGSSESKEYFIYDENRSATAPWKTLLAP